MNDAALLEWHLLKSTSPGNQSNEARWYSGMRLAFTAALISINGCENRPTAGSFPIFKTNLPLVSYKCTPLSRKLSTFRYDPHYVQQVAASGRSIVSVWGAMTSQGQGLLHRLDAPLNAAQYVDVLDHRHAAPHSRRAVHRWLLCAAARSSPIHQATTVKTFLEERCMNVIQWPQGGADLNLIENIWGLMKKQVSRKTLTDISADILLLATAHGWRQLRQQKELAPALYASLPRRSQSIVVNNKQVLTYNKYCVVYYYELCIIAYKGKRPVNQYFCSQCREEQAQIKMYGKLLWNCFAVVKRFASSFSNGV